LVAQAAKDVQKDTATAPPQYQHVLNVKREDTTKKRRRQLVKDVQLACLALRKV
jgi:hypothetical protein